MHFETLFPALELVKKLVLDKFDGMLRNQAAVAVDCGGEFDAVVAAGGDSTVRSTVEQELNKTPTIPAPATRTSQGK